MSLLTPDNKAPALLPFFLQSKRIAGVDWAATPLGPVERWSPILMACAGVCLNSPYPGMLCWGTAMASVYNVAFVEALINLTDSSLGKPLPEACPEIWKHYGSALEDDVLRQGKPALVENQAVPFQQANGVAARHVDFVFTPVLEETGKVGGVYITVAEPGNRAISKKPEDQGAFFQTYFNAIPAPMEIVDMNFKFIQLNKAYTETVGYAIEDLLDKTVFDIIHPDDLNYNADLLFKLKSGEIPHFIIEKRYIKKDGSPLWIKKNVTVVRDDEGNPFVIIATIENVDRLRETKLALQSVDQQFKQTLDYIPQLAWTAPPDGQIDFYNKSWYEYTGVPDDAGIRNWENLLHPADLSSALEQWSRSVETGENYQAEFRFADLKNPGAYRWFLGKAAPIRDEMGQIIKWFGTNTDVDDIKKIDQTLRQSEERFRRLAEEATIFVWTSDAQGYMDYINPKYKDFIGYDPSMDFRQYLITEVVHPDEVDHIIAIFQNAYLNQISYSLEARMKEKKTGVYQWYLFKAVPRRYNDQFAGFVGTGVDIHFQKMYTLELEQRVAERTASLEEANRRLENSNKELQQFAYTASHDLQEPLRKIMTFAGMLTSRSEHLSEKDKFYLQKITGASERMSILIRDVLQLSRLDRALQIYEPVDLNVVLHNIKEDLEVLTGQKMAKIIQETLPVIEAIPVQMNQLFYNLINNALKFSKEGVSPVVQIKSRKLSDKESARRPGLDRRLKYYEITVADNGIGFDEAYADKIFGVFQRLHDKSAYTGSGVGLSLCRKITDNHKGVILAHSTLGKGSAFVILLPERQ